MEAGLQNIDDHDVGGDEDDIPYSRNYYSVTNKGLQRPVSKNKSFNLSK